VLSGFVDSILTSQGRRLKTDSVTNLSRREQEVLDSLLENLSTRKSPANSISPSALSSFTSPTCSTNSASAAALT